MDIEPGKSTEIDIHNETGLCVHVAVCYINMLHAHSYVHVRTLQSQSPSTWWKTWRRVGQTECFGPQLGHSSYEHLRDLKVKQL